MRGGRSAAGTFSASLVLPSPSHTVCFPCFTASSRTVAAEWALGFRVVMAGYEYVSPEQLAGFDKYKVARAGVRPSLSLPRPRPGGCGAGAVRVTLCLPGGSVRVGRRFCGEPRVAGVGVGERESILGRRSGRHTPRRFPFPWENSRG